MGENVVCCCKRFLLFFSVDCSTRGLPGYNTDGNDRRCARGFARVRLRCLGAAGSQPLKRCEGCEVARGNDVMAASCL